MAQTMGSMLARMKRTGEVIRQVSVQDLHVQYTVKYWSIGRALLITMLEIRHWEPLDDTPALGTKRQRRK